MTWMKRQDAIAAKVGRLVEPYGFVPEPGVMGAHPIGWTRRLPRTHDCYICPREERISVGFDRTNETPCAHIQISVTLDGLRDILDVLATYGGDIP